MSSEKLNKRSKEKVLKCDKLDGYKTPYTTPEIWETRKNLILICDIFPYYHHLK